MEVDASADVPDIAKCEATIVSIYLCNSYTLTTIAHTLSKEDTPKSASVPKEVAEAGDESEKKG